MVVNTSAVAMFVLGDKLLPCFENAEAKVSYEAWRNKFLKHRDCDEQKKEEIPFPFYRDSITLFQKDGDGGRDECRWKAFYQERKVSHFADLAESQKMRLALSTNARQMVNATH